MDEDEYGILWFTEATSGSSNGFMHVGESKIRGSTSCMHAVLLVHQGNLKSLSLGYKGMFFFISRFQVGPQSYPAWAPTWAALV